RAPAGDLGIRFGELQRYPGSRSAPLSVQGKPSNSRRLGMNRPAAGSLAGTEPGLLAAATSGTDVGCGKWRRHALIVADERGRVVEWNESAALVFGYEREEVLGR